MIRIDQSLHVSCTHQIEEDPGKREESIHVMTANCPGYDHGEASAAVIRINGVPYAVDESGCSTVVALNPDECDAVAEFLMKLSRAKRKAV